MPAKTLPVSDNQPGPRVQCRVYERHTCGLPTTCHPTSTWGNKEARWRATIEDISVGGILLLLGRRFEPGAGLAIEIPGQEGEEPYTVLAKVIHAKSRGDGSWAVGSKFISELSDEELERLLGTTGTSQHSSPAPEAQPEPVAPSQLAGVDQSQEVAQDRTDKNVLAKVRLEIDVLTGPVLHCRLRRLSVGGSWPPLPGTTFTLRGAVCNGPLPPLNLVVVRCCREKDQWALRCRLLNPPAADLLRALSGPVEHV
jgi:hypothetical protein